ncbi:hypothetical protein P4O66_012638 [Electrophorus voltai]|uniref:Uncharacterized protein n=1 Tax=Electrophorus voltai TaxID=2609070 RepID=A0AAD8Z526_9TELE|nr:hypothetical protein P4O66_012638 [Electrophorus voltai]
MVSNSRDPMVNLGNLALQDFLDCLEQIFIESALSRDRERERTRERGRNEEKERSLCASLQKSSGWAWAPMDPWGHQGLEDFRVSWVKLAPRGPWVSEGHKDPVDHKDLA